MMPSRWWPHRKRSTSHSRCYKYKRQETIFDDRSSGSDTDDEVVWIPRGRGRSRSRNQSLSRSRSHSCHSVNSINTINNVGNHYHGHHQCSTPVNYSDDSDDDHDDNHQVIYCTVDDIQGHHAPAPIQTSTYYYASPSQPRVTEKTKITEPKQKSQTNQKKTKTDAEFKDIEKMLRKIAGTGQRRQPPRSCFRPTTKNTVSSVPRSLQDIDLDIAGTNAGLHAIQALKQRAGWYTGSGGSDHGHGGGGMGCSASRDGHGSCGCESRVAFAI